jgi:transcriptional regulator with XRE-family HTH domain
VPVNRLRIRDVKQLGIAVRAVRKAQGLRQDEVGRMSHSFVGDLEDGKPTAQIGKVLEVLSELGVQFTLELPGGLKLKEKDLLLLTSPNETSSR